MIQRIIIGILLVIFAVVQYNDPDPWLWILAYSIVGILTIYSAWNAIPHIAYNVLILIFAICTAWYIPKMMQWISAGMPSIVGSMKASNPHIEWMREFLGLILCLGVLWWLSKSRYDAKSVS